MASARPTQGSLFPTPWKNKGNLLLQINHMVFSKLALLITTIFSTSVPGPLPSDPWALQVAMHRSIYVLRHCPFGRHYRLTYWKHFLVCWQCSRNHVSYTLSLCTSSSEFLLTSFTPKKENNNNLHLLSPKKGKCLPSLPLKAKFHSFTKQLPFLCSLSPTAFLKVPLLVLPFEYGVNFISSVTYCSTLKTPLKCWYLCIQLNSITTQNTITSKY